MWEQGWGRSCERFPSREMAFRIARVFGVPLDQVFHYPEDGS